MEFLFEHDSVIIFTLGQLLRLIFVRIWGKQENYLLKIVGSSIVRNSIHNLPEVLRSFPSGIYDFVYKNLCSARAVPRVRGAHAPSRK